ncbi:hypothetical protein FLB_13710 [Flavobacterium succinicans]|uniref:Uncharacterized protein n=1 Tax=Flavobacterium succinicans TaxID=29536 RepID=A0A199XRW4_9FLAO|nr:hypothetical protein FLB_13710 [Flavobacterium succinicans]
MHAYYFFIFFVKIKKLLSISGVYVVVKLFFFPIHYNFANKKKNELRNGQKRLEFMNCIQKFS